MRLLLDVVPVVLVEHGPLPGPRRADAGLQVDHRLPRPAAGGQARQAQGPILRLQVNLKSKCLDFEHNSFFPKRESPVPTKMNRSFPFASPVNPFSQAFHQIVRKLKGLKRVPQIKVIVNLHSLSLLERFAVILQCLNF